MANGIDSRVAPSSATLVLLIGVAGVGKSEFARSILGRVHLTYIDKDALSDSFSRESRSDPTYTAHRTQVYDALWGIAEQNLRAGNSVLVDAPLAKEMQDGAACERIRELICQTSAELRVIRLVCSEEKVRQRLQSRANPRDAEKLRNWDSWKSEEPIWFGVPFEHLDVSTDDLHPQSVEAAARFIVGGSSVDEWERTRVLWQGALDSFNQRRQYEWQMCLAVWGAMVGVIAVLLSKDTQSGNLTSWGLPTLGFFIAILFTYWISKLLERNNLDRDIAHPYLDRLRELTPTKLSPDILSRIGEAQAERKGVWRDWNHRTQLFITWLLFAAMTLAAWSTATNGHANTSDAQMAASLPTSQPRDYKPVP